MVNYLGFNQEVPQWKDLRVRSAVMHAIDRAAIIKSIYGGAAVPANCGYVGAATACRQDIDSYAFDPAKAKALLKDAGWDKINGDKPITLLTYYNTPLAANVMAAVQAMLADVGINVVPRTVDVPTYNSIVYAPQNPDWSKFPMVYAGLQNGPDPSIVNVGLNEKQIPPAGANIMRIRMPPVTAALDAALAETDQRPPHRALRRRVPRHERQPALGHDVGHQPLRRGLDASCRTSPGCRRRRAARTRRIRNAGRCRADRPRRSANT